VTTPTTKDYDLCIKQLREAACTPELVEKYEEFIAAASATQLLITHPALKMVAAAIAISLATLVAGCKAPSFGDAALKAACKLGNIIKKAGPLVYLIPGVGSVVVGLKSTKVIEAIDKCCVLVEVALEPELEGAITELAKGATRVP
jgi:hypothetical protein